jgi:hypothetical protein
MVYIPKIPIWDYLAVPKYIHTYVGIFYSHLISFMAISYTYFMTILFILWSFRYIFPVLVSCTKKKSGSPGGNSGKKSKFFWSDTSNPRKLCKHARPVADRTKSLKKVVCPCLRKSAAGTKWCR